MFSGSFAKENNLNDFLFAPFYDKTCRKEARIWAHDNLRYSQYPCPGIQRGFMGLPGHRIKTIEQNFIILVSV